MKCPDQVLIQQLLEGHISANEAQQIEHHLLECDNCAAVADSLASSSDITAMLARGETGIFRTPEADIVEGLIERARTMRIFVAKNSVEQTLVGFEDNSAQGDTVIPGTRKVSHDASLTSFLNPPAQEDEIGRLGGYRILEVLGSGGMGVVYRAEDPRLKRQVALKVMKPAIAANPEAKTRFLKEAEATAAIEHDNIVTIYQVGEDNGVPFFAMQFLKGESLQDRLKRVPKIPEVEVLRIGREIADGLQAAHERGLIHRDIKPDNIWLQEGRDRVRIVDFGLVRNSAKDAGLTQSGVVMGTPKYMAPEQARGENVDHRCDLFSLGSVLYRMIAGRSPFEGSNLTATLIAVAHQEPQSIEAVSPDTNPQLASLIVNLLRKDREQRPPTASVVSQRLSEIERALHRSPKVATDSPETLADGIRTSTDQFREMTTEAVTIVTQPTFRRTPPRPPKKNRLAMAAGAGGLLMMLGILVITIRNKEGKETTIRVPDGVIADIDVQPGSKVSIREEASVTDTAGTPTQNGDAPGMDASVLPAAEPTVWSVGPVPAWVENRSTLIRGGDVLPGIIERPAAMLGVGRWNVETKLPRAVVTCTQYSPDGKWLAAGSNDGHIRIYDAGTMALHALLPGLANVEGVKDLAWHTDSRRIATACDGNRALRIWTIDGELIAEVAFDGMHYLAVKWLSDGEQLVCAGPNRMVVCNAAGEITKTLVEDAQSVCLHPADLAVSSTKNEVVCLHSDGVKIWNIESGESRRIGDTPTNRMVLGHGIAWSSSDIISVIDSSGIQLYEGTDHASVRRLSCISEPGACAWHPDGKHLAAWNWGHKLVYIDVEKDVANPEEERLYVNPFSGPLPTGICWSPDGKHLVAACGELNVIDSELKQIQFRSGVFSSPITDVAAIPNRDEFLSVSYVPGAEILRWKNSGQMLQKHVNPFKENRLLNIHVSPDGSRYIAFGLHDNGREAYLLALDGTLLKTLAGNCFSAAWSPDGQQVAFGLAPGLLRLTDSNGEPMQEFVLAIDDMVNVAWSSKNVLIAQAGKELFQITKEQSEFRAKPFATVATPTAEWRAGLWHPDGSFVDVFGGPASIRVNADGSADSSGVQTGFPAAWSRNGDQAVSLDNPLQPDPCLCTSSREGKLLQRRGRNSNHFWNAADWSQSGDLIFAGTDESLLIALRSDSLEQSWNAVLLPENKHVTFSAGGSVIDGDRQTIDNQLVYYTADENGRVQSMSPQEFEFQTGQEVLPIGGRYFDAEYGFTIQTDAAWKSAPLAALTVPGIARAAFSKSGGVSLNLFVQETGDLVDASWLVAESAKAQEEKLKATVLTKEVRKVAGHDAMWMIVEGQGTGSAITGDGPVKTTQHWVGIPRKSDVVVALLTSPSGTFDANQPSFLKAIETLTLRAAEIAP